MNKLLLLAAIGLPVAACADMTPTPATCIDRYRRMRRPLDGLLFDQSRQARTEPFSRAAQPDNKAGEQWLPMAPEYT
jgi:hypothetical protein